jgi:hypothetical protein
MSVSSFTPVEVAKLTRPCVYIFVKGEDVLYVGKSENGFMRFGNPLHHVRHDVWWSARKDWHLQQRASDATVLVFWFSQKSAIVEAEARAIWMLKPQFNKAPAQIYGRNCKTCSPELDEFIERMTSPRGELVPFAK